MVPFGFPKCRSMSRGAFSCDSEGARAKVVLSLLKAPKSTWGREVLDNDEGKAALKELCVTKHANPTIHIFLQDTDSIVAGICSREQFAFRGGGDRTSPLEASVARRIRDAHRRSAFLRRSQRASQGTPPATVPALRWIVVRLVTPGNAARVRLVRLPATRPEVL